MRRQRKDVAEPLCEVGPDFGEFGSRPCNEDSGETIVRWEREDHVAAANAHFEALQSGAAPVTEVPACERRNLVINGSDDGVRVLTPLALEDGRHLLVDRGWAPYDRAKAIVESREPAGPVELTAVVLRMALRAAPPGIRT